KANRHWEYNIDSFLDFIIDNQREDGQFYELIKQYDDYHWKFVNEDCYKMYSHDNLALVRLELEADIEYLVVEGAMYYYHVTGDDAWLKEKLPKLEKAIDYMTSDPKRWDKERGLVKRPFTIDTWDFAYGVDPQNRRIEENTPMSIMHGDNSGVYQAMNQLAWFNRRFGNEEKALEWEARAKKLRDNMFKYLWNGKFFMHQLHLNHDGADNLERERLSLSNTYDMNRGVTTIEESRKIIEEYMERKESTKLFSEWFSIDPAYEDFIGFKFGEYVNGAISPFTAGELAKAALNNGYEEYGWDIISRFMEMVERDKDIFFLYYPDGTPQPDRGPSAWGAAAFISAVDEGLAGIIDAGVQYDEMIFAPKFPVTPYTELRYLTGYEVNGTKVDVRYILTEEGMRYDIDSPSKKIHAHILMPKDRECTKVLIDEQEYHYSEVIVGNSVYIDFDFEPKSNSSIEILF
ncbi:MAG: hypothetical protein J6C92_08115, partial [Bacteroidaceae bacterium]|nr:hypothetical protein [Bacteroidaceae bacterium]